MRLDVLDLELYIPMLYNCSKNDAYIPLLLLFLLKNRIGGILLFLLINRIAVK